MIREATKSKIRLLFTFIGIFIITYLLPRPAWLTCLPDHVPNDKTGPSQIEPTQVEETLKVIDPHKRGVLRMFQLYNETLTEINLALEETILMHKRLDARDRQGKPNLNILPSTVKRLPAHLQPSPHDFQKSSPNNISSVRQQPSWNGNHPRDFAVLPKQSNGLKYEPPEKAMDDKYPAEDKSGDHLKPDGFTQQRILVERKGVHTETGRQSNQSKLVPECVEFVGPPEMKSPRICVHPPEVDRVISAFLRDRGHWEIDHIIDMEWALLAYPDMQVVDLGCNLGVFTVYAAGMGRHVIAVDILPANLDLLRTSLTLNDIENHSYLVRMGTQEMYSLRKIKTSTTENSTHTNENPSTARDNKKSVPIPTISSANLGHFKNIIAAQDPGKPVKPRDRSSLFHKKTGRKKSPKLTKKKLSNTRDQGSLPLRGETGKERKYMYNDGADPYLEFDLNEFLNNDDDVSLSRRRDVNRKEPVQLFDDNKGLERSKLKRTKVADRTRQRRSVLSIESLSQPVVNGDDFQGREVQKSGRQHKVNSDQNRIQTIQKKVAYSHGKERTSRNSEGGNHPFDSTNKSHNSSSVLNKTFSISQLVTILHNAVYKDRTSKLGVYIKSDGNLGGTEVLAANSPLLDSQRQSNQLMLVDTICLDDLIPLVQAPSVFLKLDVEGSEPDVLECGQKFFETVHVRYVLMEWLYMMSRAGASDVQAKPSFIIRFMTSKGFIPTTGMGVDVKGGSATNRGVAVLDVNLWYSWPEYIVWMER